MATNNVVGNHVDDDAPLINEVEEMDTIEGLYALYNFSRNIRPRVHTQQSQGMVEKPCTLFTNGVVQEWRYAASFSVG